MTKEIRTGFEDVSEELLKKVPTLKAKEYIDFLATKRKVDPKNKIENINTVKVPSECEIFDPFKTTW
jgi:hypothetical protein